MIPFMMGVIASSVRRATQTSSASVILLLHGDGADGGVVFTDSSAAARVATATGAITTSAASPKFGQASIHCAGGYLSYPASPVWNIGGSGWRVQFWYRPDDGGSARDLFFIGIPGTTQGVSLRRYADGQLGLVYGAGGGLGFTKAGPAVPSGSYRFIDVCRDPGSPTITVRVDGVIHFTHGGVTDFGLGDLQMWVGWGCGIDGGNFVADSGKAFGAVDDFRIQTSALPWSGFAPPTQAFPDPPAGATPVSAGLVFELLASKYTSGQTLINSWPSPADGSAQAAYNFVFGAAPSAAADDPTLVGAGPSAYFALDGGDYFSMAAATAFTRSMHKTGAAFTIEVWCAIADNGINVAPFFDSGTSDQGGQDMSRGVIYGDIGNISSTVTRHRFRVKTDSAALSALSVESDEIARNSVQMIAVSYAAGGASFLYKNGAYDPVGGNNTWTAALSSPGASDAIATPKVGARGDGAFKVPAGTKLYGLRVYNTNLSKVQLDQNFAAGVGVSADTSTGAPAQLAFTVGAGAVYTNGNATAISSSNWCIIPVAEPIPASGITYVEFDASAITDKQMFGVYAGADVSAGNYLGGGGNAGVSMGDDQRLNGSVFSWVDSTNFSSLGAATIGVSVDQDLGRIHWYRDGALQAVVVAFTPGTAGLHFAIGSSSSRGVVTVKQAGAASIPAGHSYLGV